MNKTMKLLARLKGVTKTTNEVQGERESVFVLQKNKTKSESSREILTSNTNTELQRRVTFEEVRKAVLG
jgi:hypothetical protein